MQVILLERIEKLGLMGDIVSVKPGFARNYLLPQKKAMRAHRDNIAYFEQQKIHLEAENLKFKEEAERIAEKTQDMALVMVRQAGDTGHLYGSVTTKDIAKIAKENGLSIVSQQVKIARPIKEIGIHNATISLHSEVGINVFINVAKSTDEAQAQWDNRNKSLEEVKESLRQAENAKEKGRHDIVEDESSIESNS